jgi:hypothetical protein
MVKKLTQTQLAEMIAAEIRINYRKNNIVIDTRVAAERLYHEGLINSWETSEIKKFANWYNQAEEIDIEKVERKAIRINIPFFKENK